MKFFAANRSNLPALPAGSLFVDLRFGGLTNQALTVNVASGVVRANSIASVAGAVVPCWLIVDDVELVVVLDDAFAPGLEVLMRNSSGDTRLLPLADTVWSIDNSVVVTELAQCVSALKEIAGGT